MPIRTYKPMKVKHLLEQLHEIDPEAELTISIDTSTYDTAEDRAFGYELMGWQYNGVNDASLLIRGEFVKGDEV